MHRYIIQYTVYINKFVVVNVVNKILYLQAYTLNTDILWKTNMYTKFRIQENKKVGLESNTNSRLIIVRLEPETNRRLIILGLELKTNMRLIILELQNQRQTGD